MDNSGARSVPGRASCRRSDQRDGGTVSPASFGRADPGDGADARRSRPGSEDDGRPGTTARSWPSTASTARLAAPTRACPIGAISSGIGAPSLEIAAHEFATIGGRDGHPGWDLRRAAGGDRDRRPDRARRRGPARRHGRPLPAPRPSGLRRPGGLHGPGRGVRAPRLPLPRRHRLQRRLVLRRPGAAGHRRLLAVRAWTA